jgi:hypothetical protein
MNDKGHRLLTLSYNRGPQAGSGPLFHPGDRTPRRRPGADRRLRPHTDRRFIEFLTANIRNPNTGRAYFSAVTDFCDVCARLGLGLLDIEPVQRVRVLLSELAR